MNHPSPFGSPSQFGGSRPFEGGSLLDKFQGRPTGEIRFPTAPAKPRPAVDPDYLRKARENDPWPEGSSCAPDNPTAAFVPPPSTVVLSNPRFLTTPDQMRLHEMVEFAVDVRKTGTPKTRRAYFSLHCSWIRDGKECAELVAMGIEGFPDSDNVTHTVKT